MSRHWKPEIVTSEWTCAEAYGRRGTGTVVLVLAAAVLIGLGTAFLTSRHGGPVTTTTEAPIEWNAVQAVPTRALSPDEAEWEKRGQDQPSPSSEGGAPSADAGHANEEVSSAADAAGRPPSSSTRGEASDGKLYVIDGDTFGIASERIRIANIDAPELHPARCAEEERLGMAAKEKLQQLLGNGTVTLSGLGHDRYGRDLRFVQVDGQDVGEAMMSVGLARAYHGEKRGGWC